MKNISILLVITIILSSVYANAQEQAPNSDFEEWETLTNGAESPSGWGSSNFAVSFGVPQTVFKTTDAVSGDFALLVTTPIANGNIYTGQAELNEAAFNDGGLPYTDRPLTMEASIKGTIYSGDVGFVRAWLTRWDSVSNTTEFIGEARIELSSIDTTYSLQIASFDYVTNAVPDTLYLVAGFGDHTIPVVNPDNQFYVDNIVFDGLSTGTNEDIRLYGVSIFPNPTDGIVKLKTDFENKADLSIAIFNSTGQVMRRLSGKQVLGLDSVIDLSNFPKGVYFIKITLGNKYFVERIVLISN